MENQLYPEVSGAFDPAAGARKPYSIRRTSTIDSYWPNGIAQPFCQEGVARDLLTLGDYEKPEVLALDTFYARLSPGREIEEISTEPPREGIEKLVGARAGGQLRSAISAALPQETAKGTPLYLLLDDIAGASLVAPWSWVHWDPAVFQRVADPENKGVNHQKMLGVCIGFRPGSPALEASVVEQQNNRPVPPLDAGPDQFSWHKLVDRQTASHRRARRIDVSFDGDAIVIETHFQDSALAPEGQRWAVHEYLVTARADRETGVLTSIIADPRILPYDICPSAILNVGQMVGKPLSDLRRAVLEELARTKGCTHLNDTVRSLAEVPQLATRLAEACEKAA